MVLLHPSSLTFLLVLWLAASCLHHTLTKQATSQLIALILLHMAAHLATRPAQRVFSTLTLCCCLLMLLTPAAARLLKGEYWSSYIMLTCMNQSQ